jgi:outer membrane protein insertion porin family
MRKTNLKILIVNLFLWFTFCVANAQIKIGGDTNKIDYANPKEFVIGGITVTGAEHMDKNVLTLISGLSVGDKVQVPGQKISDAIKNIWKQGLFEDVKIRETKFEGDKIFLDISVVEKPRLAKFTFRGISKSDATDLRDKLKLVRGKVVTDFLLSDIKQTVISEYVSKGYSNVSVVVDEKADSNLANSVVLYVNIKRGERVKIEDIFFKGNTAISEAKLRHAMKNTKRKRWYSVFHPSKMIADDYAEDKQKIIEKYNSKGYRDAKIVKDTIYKSSVPNRLNVEITINEGKRYYFGNITWIGNSKYNSKVLSEILGIKRGDIYNSSLLNQRLNANPNGSDVSSLYMDNGYLFFQVTPEETRVQNDTIDLEMHIYEGNQARVNNVTVSGNDKTNDKIIMRQIRTLPGDLFKRSDVMRTERELAQLGYFDPEKMNVVPTPNPENGTVDINYVVAEKSADQLELSGGWGGGLGLVGTAGISLNNFSIANAFKKGEWRPIPTGDGEQLSLRFQSNGLPYQSLNLSFSQPWVGGKHPNSLTVSLFTTTESNGQPSSSPSRQSINIKGASLGFGLPLKFPDDYFSLLASINYQYYTVRNYGSIFIFNDGNANSLSGKLQLMRNSIDKPIFEEEGSSLKMSIEATPPYSLTFLRQSQNYTDMPLTQKFKWLEFWKFKFTDSWYTRITNFKSTEGKQGHNLVLYAKVGFGLMGFYNPEIGYSPFNRFYLGGGGLTGYSIIDGREIIALRGYNDGSLSPSTGAVSVTKYTMELRFPISLNPQATVYTIAFLDAGNSWSALNQFNPFQLYRAAGVGVRVFLPMFGLLGFDYGWRFDDVYSTPGMQKSQFIFTIGKDLGEL